MGVKKQSGKLSQKNTGVELMRFVFAVIILLGHAFTEFATAKTPFGVVRQGAIGVEFFFVLSGILMAKTAFEKQASIPRTTEQIAKATPRFIAKKYLAIFPTHIVTFVIMFGELIWFQSLDSTQALKKLVFTLPEIFLVHMSGIKLAIINQNDWYISAMLFAMLIVYPLLMRWGKVFTRAISPVLFLLIFGYLYQSTGTMAPSSTVVAGGLFLKGTLRGIAEISLGTTVYEFIVTLNKTQLTAFGKAVIKIIEFLCYSFTVFVSLTKLNPKWYFSFVFILSVGLAITFSRYSISANLPPYRVITWLGSISMTVFVCQRAVLYPLSQLMLFRSYRFNTLAFAIGTAILSVLIKKTVDATRSMAQGKPIFVKSDTD